MRDGKDPMWGRPAVQVLVTLLDEPRLEGALRQCRPLVASSQYTAKVSKVYTLPHMFMVAFVVCSGHVKDVKPTIEKVLIH